MKTMTRVIAVFMLIAMLSAVMAACAGSYIDDRIIGSWKQTDDVDGNWTWTFEKDGKCKLVGDDGFESAGTYRLEGEGSSKIYLKLDKWPVDNQGGEKLFSYTVTPKVMDLMDTTDYNYHCFKQ